MNEQVFADALKHPKMGESAQAEWLRYRGERSEEDALIALMLTHLAHIETVRKQGKIDKHDDSVFLTDIPDYDLAVIDAYFPSVNKRMVGIYGRKTAVYVMQIMTGHLSQRLSH